MKRLILMAMLLLSCRDDEPAPAPPPPPPSVATTTASVSSAPIGLLTEEEFKALHVLKTDKPPPRRGSDVKLASSRAYLSLPAAEPPLIGLVVIHEWWGLNEHIMHWSDRLAADGYAALAVDLYDGKVATDPDEAMKLMKEVDDKKATAVLKEAVAFLGSDERIRAQRRGAIGWCFGGKWALEAALAAPELDAAVVYYGHVTTDAQRLAGLQASLLGIFAKKDKGIPPEHVDRFEFALEQAGGKDYKILRYDADHAFANPSNARYDEKSAAEAWREVRAFLKRRLKEGKPE